MKKLIGNLYWTKYGLGYRVDSPAKAKRYNRILVGVVVGALLGIVATVLCL
jgi:ABC-type nitrate/sulfonate/bicarbonate transport system permease component